MVDCSLYNLARIPNDARVRIINYVMEVKQVRARDLGVTSNLISMIRSGKRRVTEDLLCHAMAYLTPEELARLLGQLPEVEPASVNDIVKVVARAVADPSFRDIPLSYLERYLGDYIRSAGRRWVVSSEDIEAFIKAKRLRGLSRKTISDEVRYIERTLAELNWVLEPENIMEYLDELREESEYAAKHTAYSLKSFLKTILKSKDPALFSLLYNAFTTIKPRNHAKAKLPTLNQLKEIFNQLPSIEAKAYFLILAETGLRPGEPLLISMDDVDWEHGLIHIGKVTATKRAFVAFLRTETVEWLRREYMPRRDRFVDGIVKPIEASKWFNNEVIERLRNRLIPFDQSRLRREIKETARQVLDRELELYELRKFFSTWMIMKGVPEAIVNTLQGRAPPSEYRVLIEHYWSPRHEELRQWYIKHASCLLCQ